MLDKILRESLDNGSFIDIYRDAYTRDAIFSRILSIGNQILAVAEYSDDGLFDGICFLYKSDLSRIRRGGNEQKAIKALIANHNSYDASDWMVPLNDFTMTDIITNYLLQETLTVYTETMCTDVIFLAKYIEHDETWLKLLSYGTYKGLDQSELIIRINDVTRIDINTKYSKTIDVLFKSHP